MTYKCHGWTSVLQLLLQPSKLSHCCWFNDQDYFTISSLDVPLSVLTLLVGWQEGYLAHSKTCHISTKVLFQNNGRLKTEGIQSNQSSPGIRPLKWRGSGCKFCSLKPSQITVQDRTLMNQNWTLILVWLAVSTLSTSCWVRDDNELLVISRQSSNTFCSRRHSRLPRFSCYNMITSR